jgi:hypothetical protein
VGAEQNGNRIRCSQHYATFAKLISDLSNKGASPCTVITFNYDLAVDVALHSEGLGLDYGLNPNERASVNLFKLHGSVHWYKCQGTCGKILPVPLPCGGSFAGGVAAVKWSKFLEYLNVRQPQCCGVEVADDAVIVPPSWNKGEYRSGLQTVWRRAAAELKDATTIVVIGYSLPSTDEFFRYLYGLGTVGDALLERFWVFDPSETVHERFGALAGPGARARFCAGRMTFEEALGPLPGLAAQ